MKNHLVTFSRGKGTIRHTAGKYAQEVNRFLTKLSTALGYSVIQLETPTLAD